MVPWFEIQIAVVCRSELEIKRWLVWLATTSQPSIFKMVRSPFPMVESLVPFINAYFESTAGGYLRNAHYPAATCECEWQCGDPSDDVFGFVL